MHGYAVSDPSLHASMRGWEMKGRHTRKRKEKGIIWGLADCDVAVRDDQMGLA
jgi:hypothetical protein